MCDQKWGFRSHKTTLLGNQYAPLNPDSAPTGRILIFTLCVLPRYGPDRATIHRHMSAFTVSRRPMGLNVVGYSANSTINGNFSKASIKLFSGLTRTFFEFNSTCTFSSSSHNFNCNFT